VIKIQEVETAEWQIFFQNLQLRKMEPAQRRFDQTSEARSFSKKMYMLEVNLTVR